MLESLPALRHIWIEHGTGLEREWGIVADVVQRYMPDLQELKIMSLWCLDADFEEACKGFVLG